ncbi:MAG: hypothetical protein ACOZDY_17440 [Pseudomonadota bacterium]
MKANRKLVALTAVGFAWALGASAAMAQQIGWNPVSPSTQELFRQLSMSDGNPAGAPYSGSEKSGAPAAGGRPGTIRYPVSPSTQELFRQLSMGDGNPLGAPYDN